MWEYGISRCKELAKQYELETYDYVKLSKILVRNLFVNKRSLCVYGRTVSMFDPGHCDT